MNSNQKGAIAEAAIASEALKCGLGVSRPLGHDRYDLVFDLRPGLVRVQCKYAKRSGDVLLIHCAGSWFSPGTGYVRSTYGQDEIDAIAAYSPDLERCYLIPAATICGMGAFRLRLAPAQNNQRAALNWAADYEFSGAVAQLEVAPRWQRGGRGFESHRLHCNTKTECIPHVVGAHVFRNQFGYYMELAATGQEIRVTRRGKPYVRLLPAQD